MALGPWDPDLSIGGPVCGSTDGCTAVIAVEAGASAAAQSHAYLDLLHWLVNGGDGLNAGRLVLPSGPKLAGVLDALGSLEACRQGVPPLEIIVDGKLQTLERPDFSDRAAARANQLAAREQAAASPPEIVRRLVEAVADPRFVAYRNLSSPAWFGKIEGLRLCRIDP